MVFCFCFCIRVLSDIFIADDDVGLGEPEPGSIGADSRTYREFALMPPPRPPTFTAPPAFGGRAFLGFSSGVAVFSELFFERCSLIVGIC